jgi:hypothetical protein
MMRIIKYSTKKQYFAVISAMKNDSISSEIEDNVAVHHHIVEDVVDGLIMHNSWWKIQNMEGNNQWAWIFSCYSIPPPVVLMVRDALFHLETKQGLYVLKNINQSGAKYLLTTTTFPNTTMTID